MRHDVYSWQSQSGKKWKVCFPSRKSSSGILSSCYIKVIKPPQVQHPRWSTQRSHFLHFFFCGFKRSTCSSGFLLSSQIKMKTIAYPQTNWKWFRRMSLDQKSQQYKFQTSQLERNFTQDDQNSTRCPPKHLFRVASFLVGGKNPPYCACR